MKTLATLATVTEMSKSGIILPALAGIFALAFNFNNRKTKDVNIDPAIETELELPILKCKRGTYQPFEIPRLH